MMILSPNNKGLYKNRQNMRVIILLLAIVCCMGQQRRQQQQRRAQQRRRQQQRQNPYANMGGGFQMPNMNGFGGGGFDQKQYERYAKQQQAQYEKQYGQQYGQQYGGGQQQYGQQAQQSAGDPSEYYKTLGLKTNAKAKDIKSAYRKLALKYHVSRTALSCYDMT